MPDWVKIKAEYIAGGISYQKLSEKYGVSFSALRRKAKAEKWTDLRAQSEHKANIEIVENVASQEAKRAEMFDSIADMLLQQIKQDIQDGSIKLSGKGYRDITGALKDLREIKGLKSELDMQEQIARIDKLRKDIADEEENKEIKVVISTDLEEYAK